jgi:hypothetical protein
MLVQYAFGLVQDAAEEIADFLAPIVNVGATIGRYKKFNAKNAFQVYSTARAVGGPAQRIAIGKDDGTYDCSPNALEYPVDQAQLDAAGNMSQVDMETASRTLLNQARLSRNVTVVSALRAAIAATVNVGKWTAADADPIAEIDSRIEVIAKNTGMMPNALCLGLTAWKIVKNHPKVTGRFKGISGGVTKELFASVLMNPLIEIRISTSVYDQAKQGADANNANVLGSDLFLFIRSQNPDRFDPSMAKTFRGGQYGIDDVRTYFDEPCRSNIFAIDWSEDSQLIGSMCGERIEVT